jgi:hypothetical protein
MRPPQGLSENKYCGFEIRNLQSEPVEMITTAPFPLLIEQSRRYKAGWPMLSVAADWFSYAAPEIIAGHASTSSGLIPVENIPMLQGVVPHLPIRPHWTGFAINTIFYAAVLWVLFFAPGSVRRMIRRRHGLCPACAYPVGTSPVCTECGKPVIPKSVEPR